MNNARQCEKGLTVLLLALILPAIIILAALVALPSYARLSHAELQTIVDAAAHAGAIEICTSQLCYDQAKQKAIDVIGRYSVHRRSGFYQPIALSNGGPNWTDNPEYDVTILRGAWWPEGAPEGSNWTTLPNERRFVLTESAVNGASPPAGSLAAALPAYIATNAVYVRIALKNYRDPIGFISPDGIQLAAESIAVGGDTSNSIIAPFAVPACALIDPDGAYHSDTLCNRDYFFARRDRYCPASQPNCNVTPGMFGIPADGISGLQALEQCSFIHSPVASDVFGFVGSPGTEATEEDLVHAMIDGFQTHIGDSFHATESGFTSAEAFQRIRGKILDSDYRFPYIGWLGAMRYPNNSTGTGLDYPWTYIQNNPTDCTNPSNRGWGACNSMVFSITSEDNWSPNAGIPDACTGPIMGTIVGTPRYYWPEDIDSPQYWPTKAAVVAWDNMTSCQGAGGAEDPIPPNSHSDIRVIGYIDLNLYDADIAALPPRAPSAVFIKGHDYWPDENWCDMIEYCETEDEDTCWSSNFGSPEIPHHNWEVNCDSTHMESVCEDFCRDVETCSINPDTDIEECSTNWVCGPEQTCHDEEYCCGNYFHCSMRRNPWCSSVSPVSCINWDGTNRAETSHSPWGFHPPVADGDPNFQCNLVRGRIGCGNAMIPSASNGIPTRQALIVR